MRYAVHGRDYRPLAMPGFSTAAHKLAPCDRFIGWTPQKREKNLLLAIDNPRFLILPWITTPNLGSYIHARVRRQLPEDWTLSYNNTSVLIETFVEIPRFTGALCKASVWIQVGTAQGRSRNDRRTSGNSPGKTSGSDPSERAGGELSTGDIMTRCHRVTERKPRIRHEIRHRPTVASSTSLAVEKIRARFNDRS